MNWYRDKLPGVDKNHLKQWHADRGKYVVRWRDEYDKVAIPAGFQAAVLIRLEDGREMLDMVWRHKIFRTRLAAMGACEDHAAGRDPRAEYMRHKENARNRKRRPHKKVRAVIQAVLGATAAQDVQVKTRKQRSDKGQKRIKEPTPITTAHKVRKQRTDKGKPRGPRRKPV
jgi:hypothetical protein